MFFGCSRVYHDMRVYSFSRGNHCDLVYSYVPSTVLIAFARCLGRLVLVRFGSVRCGDFSCEREGVERQIGHAGMKKNVQTKIVSSNFHVLTDDAHNSSSSSTEYYVIILF